MGTRCLTHFEREGNILCTVYRQMDGYPEGHGQELADFLSGFKIVNGIGGDDENKYPKLANGLGCLAAQTIAHLKRVSSEEAQRRKEMIEYFNEQYPKNPQREYLERDYRVGSIYMTTPGETDAWQDYTYTVYVKCLGTDGPFNDPFVKQDFELRMKCETEQTLDWQTGEKKNLVLFDGKPEDFDVEAANKVASDAYEKAHPETSEETDEPPSDLDDAN